MGSRITYTCPGCGFSLGVWDDGILVYIKDPKGKKHALLHPCESDILDHVLSQYPATKGMKMDERKKFMERHLSARQDGICLDCSKRFTSSASPKPPKCRSCKSVNTVWLAEIGGNPV